MSDYAPPVEGVTTPPTIDDMPMGGCRNWRIHEAHLAAGDPKCENQQ